MTRKLGVLALFQLFVLSCAVVAQTAPAANDWKAVEQALGRSGQVQGDGAYKFGLPRGDLKVTVDGVQVKPTLALGSWVAFSSPGQNAMLMGDLVLGEDEVSRKAERRIAAIPEDKRYLTRVLDSLDSAFADFDCETAMLDLPHMQNRKPEAIKRYLEFRLRQFKMLLDTVGDYAEEKHPATGGHS